MCPYNQAKFSDQPELLLYTRPGCHLCDVAAALLEAEDFVCQKENIESDIDLIGRYGSRIPVLFRTDTGAELGWPFTAQRVRRFVESPC